MANFYTDNDDIRFLFRHYQLRTLADLMEGDYSDAQKYDSAPENADDAVDNYERILDVIGQISGDNIAPRAEGIDLEGNHLNDDGTVTLSQGMQENLKDLGQADMMAFTLPHRFGGLNCPNLVYTMSNEIVSRADASLMNIYGLQGIGETINAFATEEQKRQWLPGFAEGEFTGAMVLTEPDAGSDLQAVKLRADMDADGNWYLNGVKRFITNGCGEVLLVLARSEHDRAGGLGLSMFVCGRGPTVKIRRLENKMGIKGSPTCEMVFNNTPCDLVGERRRGLVEYVMSLMNGARIGIAAQSLGISEATYRIARDYGSSRVQFGTPIENFPAVRELMVGMKMEIEVARSLSYEACWNVDHENYVLIKLAEGIEDKDKLKEFKQASKRLKRINGMMTPLSKYYASEMCNRVTYDAIQVLGGSGFMKDYACERHARDARITSIYEGTSQLQVLAAVRGVCGTGEKYLLEKEEFPYPAEVKDLLDILKAGREKMTEAIAFVKAQPGTEYMDLAGRRLCDVAIMLIVSHLFLQQSVAEPKWNDAFCQSDKDGRNAYQELKKRKSIIANKYIRTNEAKINMLLDDIMRGDRSTITEYALIAGDVPEL
ncbi:MAG: acyl-CoA dehydrogenase family protein [Phycisphaerae bacterium]|nr:acyl-CoA dehydrogenase family protein [Phycisphaerae bacterium]